jgi:hypothetical protein
MMYNNMTKNPKLVAEFANYVPFYSIRYKSTKLDTTPTFYVYFIFSNEAILLIMKILFFF